MKPHRCLRQLTLTNSLSKHSPKRRRRQANHNVATTHFKLSTKSNLGRSALPQTSRRTCPGHASRDKHSFSAPKPMTGFQSQSSAPVRQASSMKSDQTEKSHLFMHIFLSLNREISNDRCGVCHLTFNVSPTGGWNILLFRKAQGDIQAFWDFGR
jgi:hypothetical protein